MEDERSYFSEDEEYISAGQIYATMTEEQREQHNKNNAAEACKLYVKALSVEKGAVREACLTMLGDLYDRATREKCDTCFAPEPEHKYQCPFAKKCDVCGVRIDIDNVSHRNGCTRWKLREADFPPLACEPQPSNAAKGKKKHK